VIAVELAHDFDHVVDRVEIAIAHGAVGDEHRLAQPPDLQLDEFVGRINGAFGENRGLTSPRPLRRYSFIRRNFLDVHACRELLDESQVALRHLAIGCSPMLRSGFSSLFVRVSRQCRALSSD